MTDDTQPQTLALHASRAPGHPAAIEAGTGRVRTYAELDERSSRLAHLLAAAGIEAGSRVAVVLGNCVEYFDTTWATQRSGLYVTPVNWHLTAAEAAYIVADSGSQALVASPELAGLVGPDQVQMAPPALRLCTGAGDPPAGFASFEEALAAARPEPQRDETEGSVMFYSSGTTGRPKGIKRAAVSAPYGTRGGLETLMSLFYGFSPDSVYLCPAPLYHAAPLGWSMGVQRLGGTVVVMDRFDPVETLANIERFGVTHVQMVPTMFVRLLKLPEEQRKGYDLSSLQTVIHAAAPCPVEVKTQMLDWLGPIIHEYYAGSEGNGFVAIGPDEWRSHPGSVGRALTGTLHVVGDDGREVPQGEVGTIYFEGAEGAPPAFEYHNDPGKTAAAFNTAGWSTLGDLGWLDPDGYLYLSDRRTNLIISGGVNIYPAEIENELALHPAVADVAVIGVPDPEMGQQVKAVVQAAEPAAAGPALEAELIEFCRQRLAHFKCPRSVDFVDSLPRLPTGKLAKRLLVERYEAG
ncbi:acyl-CoA synthetase [Acidiferrimicrobium sp. IK]|uniref:acyl-CoA synthetase n=1 Tax=Acidiferrimicrobium sp. IK TaxID=2871700 RepID=UPI0021CB4BE2|nr:acyl-CoA synthetase [Acidiferrimicrobium sp. IK]MCU4183225.1 acyl-CoA synthetase [Acidiferrimicrobium sp. IK]